MLLYSNYHKEQMDDAPYPAYHQQCGVVLHGTQLKDPAFLEWSLLHLGFSLSHEARASASRAMYSLASWSDQRTKQVCGRLLGFSDNMQEAIQWHADLLNGWLSKVCGGPDSINHRIRW